MQSHFFSWLPETECCAQSTNQFILHGIDPIQRRRTTRRVTWVCQEHQRSKSVQHYLPKLFPCLPLIFSPKTKVCLLCEEIGCGTGLPPFGLSWRSHQLQYFWGLDKNLHIEAYQNRWVHIVIRIFGSMLRITWFRYFSIQRSPGLDVF